MSQSTPSCSPDPSMALEGTICHGWSPDLVKREALRDVHRSERVPHVHLVGEDQERFPPEVPRVEHGVELVLRDAQAERVRGVDDKDDRLRLAVVLLPEVAVSPAPDMSKTVNAKGPLLN